MNAIVQTIEFGEQAPDLDFPLSSADQDVIQKAHDYQNFPAARSSLRHFYSLLKKRALGYDPEFAFNMANSLQDLDRSVELLELSLDTQEQYNLVDKRWARDTSSLEDALAKGRLVMELDIRMDKDGEFWASHAVGATTSFLPPFIHNLSTAEMVRDGKRFSLEDSLADFSKYAGKGHRLILELKTLGSDPEKFVTQAMKLKKMFHQHGVEGGVAVASLSPAILMAVHSVMPEVPLILNGGIVPGFSYQTKGESPVDKIVDTDKKWRAIGAKPFGEIVFSSSDDVVQRPDGAGTHTAYLMTHLPRQLLEVFRKQRLSGDKLAGLVSIAHVHNVASALQFVGARRASADVIRYYSNLIKELGVGAMSTTWGQRMSTIPGFSSLKPEEQIQTMRDNYGSEIVIYTANPEQTALLLSDEFREKLLSASEV